jgi:hypothetical protein
MTEQRSVLDLALTRLMSWETLQQILRYPEKSFQIAIAHALILHCKLICEF